MASTKSHSGGWLPHSETGTQSRQVRRSNATTFIHTKPGSGQTARQQAEKHLPPAPSIDQDHLLDYSCGSPYPPQIVDFSTSAGWSRNARASPRPPSSQSLKRSTVRSHCSASQSQASLGILDYYTRPSIDDWTVPITPKYDPAIEKFDFGLPPNLELTPPGRGSASEGGRTPVVAPESLDTEPGAELSGPLINLTPQQYASTTLCESERLDLGAPVAPSSRRSRQKGSYGIFPSVEKTWPNVALLEDCLSAPATASAALSPTTPVTPSSRSASVAENTPCTTRTSDGVGRYPPMRPRKASLPCSVRSRKDSLTSFHYPNKRIPLRLLSSSTVSVGMDPAAPRNSPTSAIGYPGSQQGKCSFSRWSDETVPSLQSTPSPSTPRPATSFSSLLGSVERQCTEQDPISFFEDDDESAFPGRKLKWKRREGVVVQRQRRDTMGGPSLERSRKSSRSLWSVMLCGCCGHADDGF